MPVIKLPQLDIFCTDYLFILLKKLCIYFETSLKFCFYPTDIRKQAHRKVLLLLLSLKVDTFVRSYMSYIRPLLNISLKYNTLELETSFKNFSPELIFKHCHLQPISYLERLQYSRISLHFYRYVNPFARL